jgi:hypothetical protein
MPNYWRRAGQCFSGQSCDEQPSLQPVRIVPVAGYDQLRVPPIRWVWHPHEHERLNTYLTQLSRGGLSLESGVRATWGTRQTEPPPGSSGAAEGRAWSSIGRRSSCPGSTACWGERAHLFPATPFSPNAFGFVAGGRGWTSGWARESPGASGETSSGPASPASKQKNEQVKTGLVFHF